MDGHDYHRQRRRAILRDHPEIRGLMGKRPATAGFAALVVTLQFGLAAGVAQLPWWVAPIAAYLVGAFCAHYLHVVIHEASHNLVFRRTALNKAVAIFANLPSVIPSAIGFRHYHLLHHSHLGERGIDADVAPEWEIALIGRGRIGKLFWILTQPISYAILHPAQMIRPVPFDRWFAANFVIVVSVAIATGYVLGWPAVLYLFLSTYFAVGPHPTGAHILQEHIIFEGSYETASYYGPINAISINHGLHIEHHDFPSIPGARLGVLRRLLPGYYEDRFQHRSRLATLWRFVTDSRVGLDTRVIHPG